jgi:hypothetical protein
MSEWNEHRQQLEQMSRVLRYPERTLPTEEAARHRSLGAALQYFLDDYDRIDEAYRERLAEIEALKKRAGRCACNAFAKPAPGGDCPTCKGGGKVPSDHALRIDGAEAWAYPDQTCPTCKGDGQK